MTKTKTGMTALLLAGSALTSITLSAAPSIALAADGARPVQLRGALELFPAFRQHDKRGPLPIMPIYDVTRLPGDWRYKRDEWDSTAISAPLGALDTVINTTRPVVTGFGFTDNGDARQAFVDVKQRVGAFFVRGTGTYKWAGAYLDGDGHAVRTGYGRDTERLILGYAPDADTSLKAIIIRDEIRDDRQAETTNTTPAGAFTIGADSIETERYIGRLLFDKGFEGTLEALHAETGVTFVDRRNNNFDLQDGRLPGQQQEANVDRRMVSGQVHGDIRVMDDFALRVGLGGLYDNHDANRSTGRSLETYSSIQYPDITRYETDAFVESVIDLRPGRLDLGLRWEHASASLGRADETVSWLNPPGTRVMSNTTARNLYARYSDTTETDTDLNAFSAVATLSRSWLDKALDTHLTAGRIARLPENQELYFARNHAQAQMRAVGNPGLDPEAHYRIEAGGTYESAAWHEFGRMAPLEDGASFRLSGSVSYDYVDDFISRTRAPDLALTWRNVDAQFTSVNVSAEWNATRTISAGLYGRATWAQNLHDDRGLYGIAPAELTFLADYHDRLSTHGTWNAGLKVRAVAGPTDADDNMYSGTGLDPEDIDGFAVLDLYAGAQLHDRIGVRLGVSNVLDTQYAELDPHYVTDTPNPGPINAPGRTFFMWTVVNF